MVVGLVREEKGSKDDPSIFCLFVLCFFAWAVSVVPSNEKRGKITSLLRNWGGVGGAAEFSFVHVVSGLSKWYIDDQDRWIHRSGA